MKRNLKPHLNLCEIKDETDINVLTESLYLSPANKDEDGRIKHTKEQIRSYLMTITPHKKTILKR